jgi:hypothetical protein
VGRTEKELRSIAKAKPLNGKQGQNRVDLEGDLAWGDGSVAIALFLGAR